MVTDHLVIFGLFFSFYTKILFFIYIQLGYFSETSVKKMALFSKDADEIRKISRALQDCGCCTRCTLRYLGMRETHNYRKNLQVGYFFSCDSVLCSFMIISAHMRRANQ